MIEKIIRTVLSNVPLICFIISVIFFAMDITIANLQKQMLRWNVGASFTWGGFFHVFFPKTASKAIGWDISPFQKEVGYYDLVVGIGGLLSSTEKFSYLAPGVILIFSVFSFAAGVNHVYEVLVGGNTSKNNSGFIMWADLLFPLILLYTNYNLTGSFV